jgi:hypothetical protein
LVLIPCATFLLRRSRSLLALGSALWVLSLVAIWGLLHWFARQPYILPSELIHRPLEKSMLASLLQVPACAILDTCLLIVPACLLFLPAWRRAPKKVYVWIVVLMVLFIAGDVRFNHYDPNTNTISPFFLITFYRYQTPENLLNSMMMPLKGPPPVSVPTWVQWVLTLLSFLGAFSVFAAVLRRRERPEGDKGSDRTLPWNDLLVLTVPILVAYMVLLLPRGVWLLPPDRYLLGFFPFAIVLLLRLYAQEYGARLPRFAVACLLVVGSYSVLTTHDAFSTYRGNLRAIDQLRASGIPAEEIDGGWEYNFDTETVRAGQVSAPGSQLPGGTILVGRREVRRGSCGQLMPLTTPDVHAVYALAWPGSACQQVAGFAPVYYDTWLPPFRREILVVRAQREQWIPAKTTP